MFAKETYIERRNKLKKEVGSGVLLFLGNNESPMNYTDNPYHFRQDSTFLYFFAISRPELAAIIDCDSGEEFIFGNDFTVEDFVWMGPQPTIAEEAIKVGVSKTGNSKQLAEYIKKAKNSGRKIHFTPPYRPENKIKIFENLNILPNNQKNKASLPLIKAIINQRNYKSAEELEEINTAVNTSVEMHKLAMRLAKPGTNEAKIAAGVQEIAVAAGGQLSFPIIATINGEILHNHHHTKTLKDGDLFLLDTGAETAMGYGGDLSSTVPVNGKFTAQQSDIYNLCLASHNRAIEMLKPDIEFKEVYYESARMIMNGLKDFGITKGNTEDALMNGAHALFFPCGLGHMMGLDIHDMEDLGEVYVGYDGTPKSTQFGVKSLRLGRKLEPGFVLTIEPGIYFIPELIDQWKDNNYNSEFINYDKLEAFKHFGGIRNEENFVITETGHRLLGNPKPKTIADVEAEWAKGI